MDLSYRQSGDYLLPNVTMETTATQQMGKYGRMRKRFLKEHRPGIYNALLLTEQLQPHLMEIDQTAKVQMEQTIRQMATTEGVTERLKAADQMEWLRRMNGIRNRAEEIVMQELIYR